MLVEVTAPAAQPSPAPAGRRHPWRVLWSGATPYLYLLPALLGLVIWIYRPLVETFQLSFFNWDLLPADPKVAAGWHNYTRVLTLPQLWAAVEVTGIYILGLLIFGVGLPVLIGVLAQQVGPRARSVYRGLLFIPVLVSPVVAATVWDFLLAPKLGVVDGALAPIGLGSINWLTNPSAARVAIVAIAGWKVIGVSVLIVTAGLAAISPEYYEAAAIDGASRWQTLRRLTLPLLSPTVLFLVITSVLLSSQIIFPLINSLTQGGPANTTTDIYYLLYQYGFTSFDVGLASAAAVLFFLAFGVLALICVRLLDRFSFYEG
jgi:multiple sugar transport system permease protein